MAALIWCDGICPALVSAAQETEGESLAANNVTEVCDR